MPGLLFSKLYGMVFRYRRAGEDRSVPQGPVIASGGDCTFCKPICPACSLPSEVGRGRYTNRVTWDNTDFLSGYPPPAALCLCSPRGITATVSGITVEQGPGLTWNTDPNGEYCLILERVPNGYYLIGGKCATFTVVATGEVRQSVIWVTIDINPDMDALPGQYFDGGSATINVRAGGYVFAYTDSDGHGVQFLNSGGYDETTHFIGPTILGTVTPPVWAGDSPPYPGYKVFNLLHGWCANKVSWPTFSIGNVNATPPAPALIGVGGSVTIGGPCRTDCYFNNGACYGEGARLCIQDFECTATGVGVGGTVWGDWTLTAESIYDYSTSPTDPPPAGPWNAVVPSRLNTPCKAFFRRVTVIAAGAACPSAASTKPDRLTGAAYACGPRNNATPCGSCPDNLCDHWRYLAVIPEGGTIDDVEYEGPFLIESGVTCPDSSTCKVDWHPDLVADRASDLDLFVCKDAPAPAMAGTPVYPDDFSAGG